MEAVKQDKKRRSSFTARRISLIAQQQDVWNRLEAPMEESNSEAGSSQDSPDVQEYMYTPEQAEIVAEIQRYHKECKDWDELLAETEKEAMIAKQKASEIVPLRDEDIPKEIQSSVAELIGQAPNYSAILQELYLRSNEAFVQLEEIAQVTRLVEEVVQEADRRFTKYADILGDMSLPKMETPRTHIRQMLAISTPKV